MKSRIGQLFACMRGSALAVLAVVVLGSARVVAKGTLPLFDADEGVGLFSAPTMLVSGGPGFYMQPAAALQPRSHQTAYERRGGSLFSLSIEVASFDAPVTVPDGTRITGFTLYYRDYDREVDVTATLLQEILPGQNGVPMATVRSIGSSAQATYTQTTAIAYPLVNSQQYAYYVKVDLPQSDRLEVNGFRVDYAYDAAVPIVVDGETSN